MVLCYPPFLSSRIFRSAGKPDSGTYVPLLLKYLKEYIITFLKNPLYFVSVISKSTKTTLTAQVLSFLDNAKFPAPASFDWVDILLWQF